MTAEITFPPLHDLSPDELERRKQHLRIEVTRKHARAGRSRSTFALPRVRVAVVSGAAVALAAGGTAIAIALGSSSGANAAPLLVQSLHGPNWSSAIVTGAGAPVLTTSASPSISTPQSTEIAGGTESQRALMQAIVDAMQPSVISKIEITNSGSDVVLRFSAPWGAQWGNPAATWQDTLIAGAFRDRANAAGANVRVSYFDGEARGAPLPPGIGTKPPVARPGDAEAAKHAFENAAAKIGVPLDDLTIYQPDGIAVSATLESDDPASFLLHQMPVFLAAARPHSNGYDGYYISLVDGGGQTVWETSWNQRISEGSVGSSPELAGCSPVQNWGPAPAPCPAK